MANKYCEIISKYNPVDVVKFKVPSGSTFYPGQVVKIETLDTGITDNIEVYSPTPVGTVADDSNLAIIVNQGFEVLTDGRLPSGNPDISTYSYTNDSPNEIVTCIMLRRGYVFHISNDALDNVSVVVPAVGEYLVPQTGEYELATAASYSTEAIVLIQEVLDTIAAGGQMGDTFLDGIIVKVIVGY